MPRLTVIIPVYNERATIGQMLDRVQDVEIDKEIVIVDDGSTDGTRLFLSELKEVANIRVIFQPENRGKGAAIRRGLKVATGRIIIIQDADLELDPRDYHSLIQPIEAQQADVVYGSRFHSGRVSGESISHYLGNRFLTLLSNLLNGLELTDVWTCYKVFRSDVIRSLELKEDRFGFEPEVTAAVAGSGWRVCEVPVSYTPRSYAMGKKFSYLDALKGIISTIRYNIPILYYSYHPQPGLEPGGPRSITRSPRRPL